MKTRWNTTVALIAMTGVLALAACAPSGGNAGSEAEAPVSAAAKLLPEEIRDAGVLRVATDPTYAPYEFVEGTELVGFDIDLANEIGKRLGLDVQFEQMGFASIIAGFDSGRYDIAMSGISDTEQRRESVDFVDYAEKSGGALVLASNATAPRSEEELCGRQIGVQNGSFFVELVEQLSQGCEEAGKQAIEPILLPSAPELILALKSGRVEGAMYDTAAGGYQAKLSEDLFEVVGPIAFSLRDGIAVPKSQTELRDAIAAAIKELIEDGTYDSLLDRWGMTGNAIEEVTINDGI